MKPLSLSRLRTVTAASILVILLSLAANAQLSVTLDTLDTSAFPTIRAKVRVLQGNSAVRGLTIGHFTVFEDGLVQIPVAGYCEDTTQVSALSVLLVIDKSGSMSNSLETAKTAARNFVDRLSAMDEMALLSFSNVLYNDQDWTLDKNRMKSEIDGLSIPFFNRGTALWDAIYQGVALLRLRTQRKVMIVLTDGRDTDSNRDFNDALSEVLSDNIIVYTIGLGSSIEEQRLRQISSATGGQYYSAPDVQDLEDIYRQISSEITTTGICELRYDSKIDCLDGSTHSIEIVVNTNGQTARANANYTLPLDSATLSFVTISIGRNHIVEAGDSITIPLELTRVSTNRPPGSIEFEIMFDRTLLDLTKVETTLLTTGFSVQSIPIPAGNRISLRGSQISRTGDLALLTFHARDTVHSVKTLLSVSTPDVNSTCTYPGSNDGMITVSGSCERAIGDGTVSMLQQPQQLLTNSPNPFNPGTWIHYTLPGEGKTRIHLYDVAGRRLKTLVDDVQSAGEYSLYLDGNGLSNGPYLIHLETGAEVISRMIMLLK